MKTRKGQKIYIEYHPCCSDMNKGDFRHMRWYGGIMYRFIHNISPTHAFVASIDEQKRYNNGFSLIERIIIPIKAIMRNKGHLFEKAAAVDKKLLIIMSKFSDKFCPLALKPIQKRILKYAQSIEARQFIEEFGIKN